MFPVWNTPYFFTEGSTLKFKFFKRTVTTLLCASVCACAFAFAACGGDGENQNTEPVTTVTEDEWNAAFEMFKKPEENLDKFNLTVDTSLKDDDINLITKSVYDYANKAVVFTYGDSTDKAWMNVWKSVDGTAYSSFKDNTDHSETLVTIESDVNSAFLVMVNENAYDTYTRWALRPKGDFMNGEFVEYGEVEYDSENKLYRTTVAMKDSEEFIYEVKFSDKKLSEIVLKVKPDSESKMALTCKFTYGTKAVVPQDVLDRVT